ncbi:response regulator [Azospirillum agricola]|uniref:response regulator n=1 Tax=Azospirillum agricola TaxID=1720247 RepID=UPI000A0F3661|nr:response regulator [Azospirillum agricola]MBP2231506.1 CheY-like chemotaxis protein/DNA-directed RNA polymerase specialized sigma24 family protein [Azospirillum agricola]SMH44174.1 Response regulator of citrate/malate metabolism [Azospirillum lipoferum]
MEQYTGHFMQHLPYLRRYARALTGTSGRGDALVTRTLEWYLEAQGAADLSRGALYRHLNQLQDEGAVPPSVAPYHPVESALMALDETDRRLYLLVNLEDLPVADAAAVLGLPPEDAVHRLTHARDRVRARLTATILIVEDDAIIAYDLAETVRGMGHIVCGNAATMDEALTLAAEHRPTLALMDIRLADGDNGLEVARELRAQRFLPVIFVTAFPDDLAKHGLEHLGPVIPKPFTRDQIEQAITRAVFMPQPEDARETAQPH